MEGLGLCVECGDPCSEHRAGVGPCGAIWGGGACACRAFAPRWGSPTAPPVPQVAGSCVPEDVEILISPSLAAGFLPGPNPAAYRARCTRCGAEQGRVGTDPKSVIYLTERAAHHWAVVHAGGAGVAG